MRHKFSTFTALTEELSAHYKNLIKNAEERTSRMCKLSKETWAMLDKKEQLCEKWIEELERVLEEQVGNMG